MTWCAHVPCAHAQITPAVDVYAYGATLYHAASRSVPPTQTPSANPAHPVYFPPYVPLPPIPGCAESLSKLMANCTTKEPSERPKTYKDLIWTPEKKTKYPTLARVSSPTSTLSQSVFAWSPLSVPYGVAVVQRNAVQRAGKVAPQAAALPVPSPALMAAAMGVQ